MLNAHLLLQSPDHVAGRLASRGVPGARVTEATSALAGARAAQQRLEAARADLNERSRTFRTDVASGAPAARIQAELKELKREIKRREQHHQDEERRARTLLLALPNLPGPHSPHGHADADCPILRQSGLPRGDRLAEPHWQLAQNLSLSDPDRSAKISGSGFSVLRGQGARLLRALITLGLDLHRSSYEELVLPQLVREGAMTGSGHLPEFAGAVHRTAEDDLFAVPTAEVPLTALHSDEVLAADALPLRYMAHTACFRREAGGSGRGSRGMQRLREYHQVELSMVVEPGDGERHFAALLADAERALARLELPYRVAEVCTGRLPFTAARAVRLDVYAEGMRRWLPVSSVTWAGDFQARRSNIRVRRGTATGRRDTVHVHTLNASALAASRLWGVLIENGRKDSRCIALPSVLHPYMGTDHIVTQEAGD